MSHRILIVATREFRQIAAARSFWITLLIIPFALAIGPIAQHFMQKSETETVMLIDPAGKAAGPIRQRIELDEQRRVLSAVSRYARRQHLDRAEPNALWAQDDDSYSDAEVAAFVQAGGAAHAHAVMRRAAPAGTPAFEAPEPAYRVVQAPPAIASSSPAELARRMPVMVSPPTKLRGQDKLDYAVLIPPDFGAPGATVQIWSDGPPSGGLMAVLQDELTSAMRARFLRAHGISVATASALDELAPSIAVNRPAPGEGHEQVVIRSILPLLTSYILLMSLMLSGSWMLQGTVEERSNKLIETVLACVSPNELMYGKLVGTVAIGLTMVAFWVLCAVGAAFATQGLIADFLRPALAPLAQPGIALAMIFYFVAGYMMVSMIFLAIGAMSDSFRDAQAYLTPVLLVIAMPFAIIAQAILRDPSSTAVRVMSWIPIYTPFTMLARMGAGVPPWELIGCGLMLAGFVAIEVILLGRVFRASLLSAGSKPSLGRIGRLMIGRDAD
jgi:ABC-2 type transport system permease protein